MEKETDPANKNGKKKASAKKPTTANKNKKPATQTGPAKKKTSVPNFKEKKTMLQGSLISEAPETPTISEEKNETVETQATVEEQTTTEQPAQDEKGVTPSTYEILETGENELSFPVFVPAPQPASAEKEYEMNDELNTEMNAENADTENDVQTASEQTSDEKLVDNQQQLSNRKIVAELKRQACQTVRDVISTDRLGELVENEDFMTILKLAVGFKEEAEDAGPKNPRTKMKAKMQQIEAMFREQGKIDEMTMFEKFTMGRAEMRAVRRKFATKENAAERLYISLILAPDDGTSAWQMVGSGEEMPAEFHLQSRQRKES